MSLAVSGIGVLFRRWDGSNYATIAEVNSVGIKKTRDTIEVTSFDSVNGYKEFIGGLRDGGTVPFKMNFTRDGYDKLNEDFETDTLGNYEIVLPDVEDTSFEFEGLVTDLGFDAPVSGVISTDATIKISGQVVENSGGSSGLT